MDSTFTVLAALKTLMETNYCRSFSNKHSSCDDSTNQNIGMSWQQKWRVMTIIDNETLMNLIQNYRVIQDKSIKIFGRKKCMERDH